MAFLRLRVCAYARKKTTRSTQQGTIITAFLTTNDPHRSENLSPVFSQLSLQYQLVSIG